MLDRPHDPQFRILSMAYEGKTSSEIADAMEGILPRRNVLDRVRRLRKSGKLEPLSRRRSFDRKSYRTMNVSLSDDVCALLLPFAQARNISISRLCGRIIDAGADCVDAILDDRA